MIPALVHESPSSSDCIIRPLDFELLALSSILSVDDNLNSQRRVTSHVRLSQNYCMRIRLVATAGTTHLGYS